MKLNKDFPTPNQCLIMLAIAEVIAYTFLIVVFNNGWAH